MDTLQRQQQTGFRLLKKTVRSSIPPPRRLYYPRKQSERLSVRLVWWRGLSCLPNLDDMPGTHTYVSRRLCYLSSLVVLNVCHACDVLYVSGGQSSGIQRTNMQPSTPPRTSGSKTTSSVQPWLHPTYGLGLPWHHQPAPLWTCTRKQLKKRGGPTRTPVLR